MVEWFSEVLIQPLSSKSTIFTCRKFEDCLSRYLAMEQNASKGIPISHKGISVKQKYRQLRFKQDLSTHFSLILCYTSKSRD